MAWWPDPFTAHHHKWHTETITETVTAACSAAPPSATNFPPVYWHGWQSIEYMVVFGDSYTTTGFNYTQAQPSIDNPLGNPVYPGYTSSNGPNWVDFLTTTYNTTFLKTLNLAYGGATIDGDLVAPFIPTVLSVKQQIRDQFLPYYADGTAALPWKPENTLFAIFDGINDIGNSYANANSTSIYPEIFDEFAMLVDELYTVGGRNFLFLNVPPVNRSPLTKAQGHSAEILESNRIAEWNFNVTRLAYNLSSTYHDASTFIFDTHAVFTQVLDDPRSFPETCRYKNVTDYCEYYQNGTPDSYTFYQNCSIPVDEYFWLNTLHPTFPMHDVIAQQVARMLS